MNSKILCLILFSSLSYIHFSCGNAEEGDIKKLLKTWSALDPQIIGGPRELNGLVTIESIVVGNIDKNGLRGETTTAVLTFVNENGQTKRVTYSLDKYDNKWEINAIDGNGCYPFINLQVMEARKTLNLKTKD